MAAGKSFTTEEAREVGEAIGIDWASAPFDVEQFRMGMDVELEHGLHDPSTNVTGDDPTVTGKIALAHLNELSDYYTRLERMEAEAEGRIGTGGRLLIATGAVAVEAADVPDGVRLLVDAAEAIYVTAPKLPSRLEWISSDTDKATMVADERLAAVLGQLHELGADAEGAVGSDDPLVALEDAIRSFSPDHIVIGLRTGDRSGWQEHGLLETVERRFGTIPLTIFQL